jgi:hypothetical protein
MRVQVPLRPLIKLYISNKFLNYLQTHITTNTKKELIVLKKTTNSFELRRHSCFGLQKYNQIKLNNIRKE